MQSYFMAASGLMIILIGVIFLVLKIFHRQKSDSTLQPSDNKNLILIGFSAGIVPCPVALMIMLLTLSRSVPLIGLISVLSISAGMFFLLSILGGLCIKSRSGIMAFSGKFMKNTEIISTIIEFISIIMIILIGLAMSFSILTKIIIQD